jgi:hypothetical protein
MRCRNLRAGIVAAKRPPIFSLRDSRSIFLNYIFIPPITIYSTEKVVLSEKVKNWNICLDNEDRNVVN